MPVTSVGTMDLAFEKLASLVALTETFRDGRTHADALRSINWKFRDVEAGTLEHKRPFAILDVGSGQSYEMVAGGDQNYLRASGSVLLTLEADWPTEFHNDAVNARRVVGGYFGKIIDELSALAGKDVSTEIGGPFSDGSGDLMINGIDQQEFSQVDPDEWPKEEWFFQTQVLVSWGDG